MRIKFSQQRKNRKKKVLNAVKGMRGRVKTCANLAKDAMIKKYKNCFIGRKQRKRDMRSLWITRINAAARQLGTTYSTIITKLQDKFSLNRKSLSELATRNFEMFKTICNQV